MKLYPAIDLRGGQAVRLYQGDYDQMTVYNADPAAQAREFIAAGAKYLHVVDLDGAKDDTTANMTTIAAIAKQGVSWVRTTCFWPKWSPYRSMPIISTLPRAVSASNGPARSSTPTANISRWAKRSAISAGRCGKSLGRKRRNPWPEQSSWPKRNL